MTPSRVSHGPVHQALHVEVVARGAAFHDVRRDREGRAREADQPLRHDGVIMPKMNIDSTRARQVLARVDAAVPIGQWEPEQAICAVVSWRALPASMSGTSRRRRLLRAGA
jgi:hypothetical protein